MKKSLKLTFLTMLVACAIGCASIGTRIDWDQLPKLRVGQTQEEVIKIFGQPTSVTTTSEGETVLVWVYSEADFIGNSHAESLRLPFDKAGKLTAIPKSPVLPK